MNLTRLSIKRPVSAVLIILSLIVFGISALFSFPQELTPTMEMPMLIVNTIYPGASPEDVEELISKKFEDAASILSGVKDIESYSLENASVLLLQYEYGTDMDQAYTDLKKKLDSFTNSLPEESSTPIIVELDLNAQDAAMISISGKTDQGLLNYVNNTVVPELEKLSKVASVNVSGGQEDYISIELIDEHLKQYNLDMNTIVSCLSAANFALPAGNTMVGKQSLAVSAGKDYNTADALKQIPIPLGNGNIIHLSDVANIHDSVKNLSSISRYNGETNITIGIQKQQSASAVDVTKDVQKVIHKLSQQNPELNIEMVYTSSDMITSSLSSVGSTLILGVVISMLILFLFFGDFKASLIVGSSIPVSLLTTFVLMNLMGFSLNIISMSSLVIGVGMMVDNSIVVLESCFRSKDKTLSFAEIAMKGTKTVTSSIIASTATTCVVFLPLGFMQGMSGQLFQQLGFTIVFSMLASLLAAMTIVPLAFSTYRPIEKSEALATNLLTKLENGYESIMSKILPKKKTVMFFSIILLVFSFLLATQIRSELIPNIDEGSINITASTKPGLELEELDKILLQLEDIVQSHPDTDYYSSTSGSSGLTGMSLSSGSSSTISVHLKKERLMSTDDVIKQWRQETRNIVDCDISIVSTSTTGGMSGATDTLQIDLASADYESAKAASKQLVEALRQRGDLEKVHSSIENAAPLVKVEVDPVKAAAEGFTPFQIAVSMNQILSGKEAATIQRNGHEISVFVEYPEDKYKTIDQMKNITLTSPTRRLVPLTDVANIVFKDSPQLIIRKNSQYLVSVTANPISGDSYQTKIDVLEAVGEMHLGEGVSQLVNATDEAMAEEFGSLIGAIGIAIFLVFIVMAMQFESPKFSLMVMICIPFSLIGSFGLLFLTNSTLSMPSLLGFLMLIGTVVNNGILFIDTTNQLRVTMPVEEALIKAGSIRLRPILMTTLTTALSMIPMALGIGDGSEMMMGLAVVVIGGLLASTVLSLLMLPTFYLIMNGRRYKNIYADAD